MAKRAHEETKRQKRPGVGTSVAELRHGPVDDFLLLTVKLHVEQLRPKQSKMITVKRDDSIQTLFTLLTTNNIFSCPVLNKKGKYYGFVDMKDIVVFAKNLFPTKPDVKRHLLQKESRFSSTPVSEIMTYPVKKQTPYHPHRVGTSLFSAWELLAKEGLHRIPVITHDEEITDIITQSMLIDFLWQNIETITTAADMKVSKMEKPIMDFKTILESERAVEAFHEMGNNNLSGLGVVDTHGKLVDVIALRDLKLCSWEIDHFENLWDTVGVYKSNLKKLLPTHTPPKLSVVVESDTLFTVVEKMATEHIHRVFVVDTMKSMKPIRVITQTDVLHQLLKLEPIFPAT